MALMAAASALPARAKAEGDTTMKHVVLLGDSIFDNKRYVGDGPDVIDQLKADLPSGWTASLNAVDGSTTLDIASQLERLPSDATHLVVSVGGNDALKHKDLLDEKASSVAEVLDKLGKIKAEFQANYRTMLDGLVAVKLPTALCTIYDAHYRIPTRTGSPRRGSRCSTTSSRAKCSRAACRSSISASSSMRTRITPTTSSLRSKAAPRSRR